MFLVKSYNKSVVDFLKNGKVGVIPTDTIYGIVGSALIKKTVEKIYGLRKRNKKKPMIVLIGKMRDLKFFGVKTDDKLRKFLNKIWPGKVSVILDCKSSKFSYLHRGTESIAFRMPANKKLRELLSKTGPLVAPSANPEGKMPSRTIKQAIKYFEDKQIRHSNPAYGGVGMSFGHKSVDFYVDGGLQKSLPSTLVGLENGKIVVLRKGAVKA